MAKLDVAAQIEHHKRHEDRLPATRQDARTLLTCARELSEIGVVVADVKIQGLLDLWRKRAERIERGDADRAPGFLLDEE